MAYKGDYKREENAGEVYKALKMVETFLNENENTFIASKNFTLGGNKWLLIIHCFNSKDTCFETKATVD